MRCHRIGYWRWLGSREIYDPSDADLPDPRLLVNSSWNPDAKQLVIDYLKGGKTVIAFGGHSTCRFNCGIPPHRMGSKELSDGLWCWPEGLAHYVEIHSVELPQEFVDHVVKRSFRNRAHVVDPPHADFDLSLWNAWARPERQPSHKQQRDA
jgi:hypothetical protein